MDQYFGRALKPLSMGLTTRLLICQTLFSLLFGMAMANYTGEHLSALDQAIKTAFELHNRREQSEDLGAEHLKNEQKNQGLINTLINHNNQLKKIDNKFNFIINNFANSSHVKEISEKTKELEMHIGGPPQPHRSWREFVLVTLVSIFLVGGSIWLIRKCCIPRVFKHVQEKLREKSLEVPTVSKQKQMEGQKEKDSCNMVDLMNYIEQQLNKQNHQLELLARRLNEAQPTH